MAMNKISVIIPAYNEEAYIQETLNALQQNESLEIILVDNGSTDKTVEIAKHQGVKVIDFPEGSIAAVRNKGVQESVGDVLIFIDSDVRVTNEWHQAIPDVVEQVNATPNLITGCRYCSPNNKSLLNKYWYTQLTQYEASYINAGNLIVSRKLFYEINGFSENLETAEDYDFCQKANLAGAILKNNPALVVTHDGYPQTLSGFIQRERWHGRQDVDTWPLFLASKIAWLASFNLILLLAALILTVVGVFQALPIYFMTMYIVSFLLTIYKFGLKNVNYMLVMPVIFYFYLCGRSLAIVDRVTGYKRK